MASAGESTPDLKPQPPTQSGLARPNHRSSEPHSFPRIHRTARRGQNESARRIPILRHPPRQPGIRPQSPRQHDWSSFEPRQIGSERRVSLQLRRSQPIGVPVLSDLFVQIPNPDQHFRDPAKPRRCCRARRKNPLFPRREIADQKRKQRSAGSRPHVRRFPRKNEPIGSCSPALFRLAHRDARRFQPRRFSAHIRHPQGEGALTTAIKQEPAPRMCRHRRQAARGCSPINSTYDPSSMTGRTLII